MSMITRQAGLRGLILTFLALAVLLAVPSGRTAALPAPAQPGTPDTLMLKTQSRGGFLEFLFGPSRRPEDRRPGASSRERPRGSTSRSRNRSYTPQAAPKETEVAKNEDARRVVVFGDAFASGLARGLERIYSEASHVAVFNETKPGSGVVRDDYHDWNAELAKYLESGRVDIAVMMIGSNDRQQMRLPEGREPVRSEKWESVYIERVDGLLKQFADKRIPVFWVGLPIMRSQSYGEDMAYLNEIYKARTSRYGAVFVETWDRFADEDGRYNASGPDVIGKIRTLRTDNGIHMTRTGYEKIAYFLDKELQPYLQSNIVNLPALGVSGAGVPAVPKGPVEVEMSLTSPPVPASETELVGANPASAKNTAPPPRDPAAPYKVLVLGQSVEPKTGRADDFSWPRGEASDDAGRTGKAGGGEADGGAASGVAAPPAPQAGGG